MERDPRSGASRTSRRRQSSPRGGRAHRHRCQWRHLRTGRCHRSSDRRGSWWPGRPRWCVGPDRCEELGTVVLWLLVAGFAGLSLSRLGEAVFGPAGGVGHEIGTRLKSRAGADPVRVFRVSTFRLVTGASSTGWRGRRPAAAGRGPPGPPQSGVAREVSYALEPARETGHHVVGRCCSPCWDRAGRCPEPVRVSPTAGPEAAAARLPRRQASRTSGGRGEHRHAAAEAIRAPSTPLYAVVATAAPVIIVLIAVLAVTPF